jgi:hypothetical protein
MSWRDDGFAKVLGQLRNQRSTFVPDAAQSDGASKQKGFRLNYLLVGLLCGFMSQAAMPQTVNALGLGNGASRQ